jgi:hypothetical protein
MKLRIVSCVFLGSSTPEASDGGALLLTHCVLSLTNSTFIHFIANQGGAIFLSFSNFRCSSSHFSECASTVGGAVYASQISIVAVLNTTFSECTARSTAGSLALSSVTNATFQICHFRGCSADSPGGALSLSSSNCTLWKCEFWTDAEARDPIPSAVAILCSWGALSSHSCDFSFPGSANAIELHNSAYSSDSDRFTSNRSVAVVAIDSDVTILPSTQFRIKNKRALLLEIAGESLPSFVPNSVILPAADYKRIDTITEPLSTRRVFLLCVVHVILLVFTTPPLSTPTRSVARRPIGAEPSRP